MASGFRADRIGLQDITVQNTDQGSVLGFTVLFQDPDGIVHGIMQHKVDPAETPMGPALEELLKSIAAWAEQAHFTTTSASSAEKSAGRGIAEALRGSSVEDPAPFRQDDP